MANYRIPQSEGRWAAGGATQILGGRWCPLRIFFAVVFLYAGLSKIADRRFLERSSALSIQATLASARHTSPIRGLLGPISDHAWGFGVFTAVVETAIGVGLLLGLFTRIAAIGGMLRTFGLWLTVSWQSTPWFTSADIVYVFALSPLVIVGPTALSLDGWLADVRTRQPDPRAATTRRALLTFSALCAGLAALGVAALTRTKPKQQAIPTSPGGGRSPTASPSAPGAVLTKASAVSLGGGTEVTDPDTGQEVWVLQLAMGSFTALDAACPHQGCTVSFVSADAGSAGFVCPCHGSQFHGHWRSCVRPGHAGPDRCTGHRLERAGPKGVNPGQVPAP